MPEDEEENGCTGVLFTRTVDSSASDPKDI